MAKKTITYTFTFILITLWFLTGWPPIWQNPRIPPKIQEAYADTETIRPTGSYSQEAWTTPENGYDGNTSTSGSLTNINKAPSISFGGATAGEATNAWGTKSQTWTSATLYLTFSKTAGTNDTVEVLITDQNGTLKHTIVSSTSSVVTKQEFSQALSSADWGGSGFPNIANLRVRVNGVKSGGPDGVTSYMYDIRIDGQYTAVNVSVTLTSDGTVPYDIVALGGNKSTIDLSDTQTAQNNGDVTENFNIKTSNATGGTQWVVGSSAGSDIYVHEFSINNGGQWTILTTADSYQSLTTGITTTSTQNFDLRITAPSTSTDYQEKTITVTIQAVQQ
ncbi:MAG: hypothetical protein ABH812_01065 [bacterium]